MLLGPAYQSVSQLFRADADVQMWVIFVAYIFFAFFFTLIFSKGYEGRGVLEGVRYGFYVAMMMVLPMNYVSYAVMPIPYSLALNKVRYLGLTNRPRPPSTMTRVLILVASSES